VKLNPFNFQILIFSIFHCSESNDQGERIFVEDLFDEHNEEAYVFYNDAQNGDNNNIDVKIDDEINPCPQNMSFLQYRNENMHELINKVHKKVIKKGIGEQLDLSEYKVIYEFSMFLEGQLKAFDSNKLCKRYGLMTKIGGNSHYLKGIEIAISSMKCKEESLFWLSHELMFKDCGCPPRIGKKADILLHAKIIKILNKNGVEVQVVENKFDRIMRAMKKSFVSALKTFEVRNYEEAIKKFNKVIENLEKIPMNCDEEEALVRKYLIKSHTNIAICYNKIEWPQRSMIHLRKLETFIDIKSNRKALYTKGKASAMLDLDEEALKYFRLALRLDPDNKEIANAIADVKKAMFNKQCYNADCNKLVRKAEHERWNQSSQYESTARTHRTNISLKF
jgi:FK506-binding protein 6